MLLRSMQNTRRELADAKAENDALRDDAGGYTLPVAYCAIHCRVKPPPPPAWIMQPPPTGRHRCRDYHLAERG